MQISTDLLHSCTLFCPWFSVHISPSTVTFHNHSPTNVKSKYKSVALLSLSVTGKNDKKREKQAWNEKFKKKQRHEYGWVNARRNHLLKLISQASLNTKWQDIKYVLFMKCLCSLKRVSSAVNYSAIHSEKIISNGKWKQG